MRSRGAVMMSREGGGQPREWNGRFSSVERGEDENVSLSAQGRMVLSDEEWNQDGTYLFPPAPRNADQHLAFWMRVRIPDAILDQVKYVYSHKRAQIWNDWVAEEGKPTWEGMDEATRQEWNEVGVYTFAQYLDYQKKSQIVPQAIGDQEARWVVRAYQAGGRLSHLPRGEQEKVLLFTVPLQDGDMTIQEVMDLYDFDGIGMEMSLDKNPTHDVREAIERLHTALLT